MLEAFEKLELRNRKTRNVPETKRSRDHKGEKVMQSLPSQARRQWHRMAPDMSFIRLQPKAMAHTGWSRKWAAASPRPEWREASLTLPVDMFSIPVHEQGQMCPQQPHFPHTVKAHNRTMELQITAFLSTLDT